MNKTVVDRALLPGHSKMAPERYSGSFEKFVSQMEALWFANRELSLAICHPLAPHLPNLFFQWPMTIDKLLSPRHESDSY